MSGHAPHAGARTTVPDKARMSSVMEAAMSGAVGTLEEAAKLESYT